jgi:hypothetical protein
MIGRRRIREPRGLSGGKNAGRHDEGRPVGGREIGLQNRNLRGSLGFSESRIFHHSRENRNFPGSLGFGLVGWCDSIKGLCPLLRGTRGVSDRRCPFFYLRCAKKPRARGNHRSLAEIRRRSSLSASRRFLRRPVVQPPLSSRRGLWASRKPLLVSCYRTLFSPL